MKFYKNIVACVLAVTLSVSPALGARQVFVPRIPWTQNAKLGTNVAIPLYPVTPDSDPSIVLPLDSQLPTLGQSIAQKESSHGIGFQAHEIVFSPIAQPISPINQEHGTPGPATVPRSISNAHAEEREQRKPGILTALRERFQGGLYPKPLLDQTFDQKRLDLQSGSDSIFAYVRNNLFIRALLSSRPHRLAAQVQMPLPAHKSQPNRISPRLWAWVFAASALITTMALGYNGLWLSEPWPFIFLVGMAAYQGGLGKNGDNNRATWSRRFQAQMSIPLHPGEAFHDLDLKKPGAIVREGLENGYIYRLLTEAGQETYLYAAYQDIPGTSDIANQMMGQYLETGVNYHNHGEYAAALIYFAKTEELLAQAAAGTEHSPIDPKAWQINTALLGVLINNSLVALYRDYLTRHPKALEANEQQTLQSALESMVFAYNHPQQSPPITSSQNVSLTTLRKLASEVAGALQLPDHAQDVDTPAYRHMAAAIIENFVQGPSREQWEASFRSSSQALMQPGDALEEIYLARMDQRAIQEGLELGYLFRPSQSPHTYLYAAPMEIPGAEYELNRHFASLIAEGVRRHAQGEFIAAFVYFLTAQQYLDQEIQGTGFHKRKPDQRAYASNRGLTTFLLWNTIPDLFRDHMRRHSVGLLPKLQKAMDALLDSSFLAANRPIQVEFPVKVVENARSAMQALASEMEDRLTLPAELDTPERRRLLLETVRQFIAVMTGEANSGNQATQRVTSLNAKPSQPTLKDMLVLSAVRDRWVDPAQFSLDEIAQAALRALKGLPGSYDGEVARFERFLERALRYTYFPRRLMRVLSGALASSSSWEKSLLEPGPKYTEEVLWKLDVENLLADVVPQLIEALGKKLARGHPKADPNNIAGIFIVGGFTQHPALGNDPNTPASDFNYLVVTQSRDMGPARVFSQYLRSLRTQYRTFEKLSDTTFHGAVLLGSRDFHRELELGSVYIDAEGQIQRAKEEILDLGAKP